MWGKALDFLQGRIWYAYILKQHSGHRMENPLRGQEREEVDCLRGSARDDALELGQRFRTAARSYIDEESWKRGEWNLLTDWICWRKTRRARSGSCPIPAARVEPCAPTRPLQSRREQSCRLLCCLAEVEQPVSESFPSLGPPLSLSVLWLERVGFCYHVGLFGVLSLCPLAFLVGQFLPARRKPSKFNHRVIPWVSRFLTHLLSFHRSVYLGLFYIQCPEVLVVLGRRNRGKYAYSVSWKRKVFWFFLFVWKFLVF